MSEQTPVRLAILGAGTIGTIHGLCSLQVPEAVVTAVWSRSAVKAHSLAERLGARAYESVEEAISADDVDAVLVCTPTMLHKVHALAAIAAGKHVICEKPIARHLAEADAMISAAEDAGVQLFVGHVVRFYPEFRRLHELVEEGAIGRPAVIHMSRVAAFPRGSGDWHNDLHASGGALLDMGIHDIDWLLWTLGPAVRIHARGLFTQSRSFLDYALMTLRFASGAIAHVETSWAEPEGFAVCGEIAGDRGLLAYDSANSSALRIDLRQAPSAPAGVNVPTTYTQRPPQVLQLEHFCRCIQGREAPIITVLEAREALRIGLAGLESIRSGMPIVL